MTEFCQPGSTHLSPTSVKNQSLKNHWHRQMPCWVVPAWGISVAAGVNWNQSVVHSLCSSRERTKRTQCLSAGGSGCWKVSEFKEFQKRMQHITKELTTWVEVWKYIWESAKRFLTTEDETLGEMESEINGRQDCVDWDKVLLLPRFLVSTQICEVCRRVRSVQSIACPITALADHRQTSPTPVTSLTVSSGATAWVLLSWTPMR